MALMGQQIIHTAQGEMMEEPMSVSQLLHELAKSYHDETEAYDRSVCTGPIGPDGIIPANHREMGMINMNARDVMHKLTKQAEAIGITKSELHKAIANYRP